MENNKNKKVNFDLSELSLKELVTVYENIDDFIQFLNSKVIVQEEKVEK